MISAAIVEVRSTARRVEGFRSSRRAKRGSAAKAIDVSVVIASAAIIFSMESRGKATAISEAATDYRTPSPITGRERPPNHLGAIQ